MPWGRIPILPPNQAGSESCPTSIIGGAMIKRVRELAAAILLGLGTWSSVRAQEPLPAPTVEPTSSAVGQPCADGASGGSRFAERRAAGQGAVKAHYNRHGYCCAEDPAIPGCPS